MTKKTDKQSSGTYRDGQSVVSSDKVAAHFLGAMRAVFATQKAGVFHHSSTPTGKMAMLDEELKKAAAGEEHNALIVENARELRHRYMREAEKTLMDTLNSRTKDPAEILTGPMEDWNLYPNLKPEPAKASNEKSTAKTTGDKKTDAADAFATDPDGDGEMEVSTSSLTATELAPLNRSVKIGGEWVPAYDLDRRFVERPNSNKPLFSEVAAEKIRSLRDRHNGKNKDAETMQMHADLFIELIGDHPVDTYVGADVQAFIKLMTHYPASLTVRKQYDSTRDVLAANRDLQHKPLKLKSLRDKYVGNIKTILNFRATDLDYRPPLSGYKLWYPQTAEQPQSAEPLSSAQVSALFAEAVRYGQRDEAILPLLGHLTGRRLGLLIHLKGSDFREKYPGIFVAQTSNIVQIDGVWKRRPLKTQASASFFVLHDFLVRSGFVEWARSLGDEFLFPGLMRLTDPSKSGAQYMSRLFARTGIETGNRREVFHSLRGGNIDAMRDAGIDKRDRKLQAGHQIGEDEHDLYGFRAISEVKAEKLAHAPLDPKIDFSPYEGLDWSALDADGRKRGRSRRALPKIDIDD